ncbi:glycerophosphodiester phosphodiesterase [Planctomyces sp. SH-PL14]|uniref:glycerophosphodiester phosphodiesterase n=1 Tax=Planctomyces sp. SH-PL14 TaxID=1632864 RepID=UPI00078D046C|nr:glycerophosphodiester phosphodiesterase family protein [Planctomyces sp. SH-PL14]AMV21524.1 Glycerophosphoryl diester phosphodiesterase [Planctomyces sp. SH-PL14]
MPVLARLLALSLCLAGIASAGQPLVVAHRGLLQHAPENTLSNFRACLELRLGFEFDVERTKDGHLVCLHDDTVNRTTNGTGKIAELTLEELRRLDAGSWFDPRFAGETVPTIEEVLALVAEYSRHEVLVAVDLKAAGVEEEVARLAEKHKVLPRLIFIGKTISDPRVRQGIRRVSPAAHTAALANTPEEFPAALTDESADWVYLRFLPSPKQMKAVEAAKKRAFIAGVTVAGQLPDNWQQAAEAGVDGILTDYPLELRALLRKRGP